MIVRKTTNDDIENVGRVIYKAFSGIADKHNFPYDFPTPEFAVGFAEMTISNPDISGFVAEDNGNFLGSNFLWKQNSIAGVGPITVNPDVQSRGVGRKLMEAVIDDGRNYAGIRLVQDAFNTSSMPLYASLGFDVVEPLVVMQGIFQGQLKTGSETRRLVEKDIAACAGLGQRVHGFERGNELRQTSQNFPAFVVEREDRIVGYATAPAMWQLNHAVAETVDDMKALLYRSADLLGQPVSFLLPTRQAELFRWCLEQGLRVVKPMTLMAMGSYQKPAGSFLPSVLY